jgi:hypothetical protein
MVDDCEYDFFACVKITPKQRKKNRVESAVEFLPEESDTK